MQILYSALIFAMISTQGFGIKRRVSMEDMEPKYRAATLCTTKAAVYRSVL